MHRSPVGNNARYHAIVAILGSGSAAAQLLEAIPPPSMGPISADMTKLSYYALGGGVEKSYSSHMTGDELPRRLRRLGRKRGISVRLEQERGKGSHSTLYFGDRFSVLKDRRAEIGPGLLHATLRQLGLSERELR